MRLTDVTDTHQLLRLIKSIPYPKCPARSGEEVRTARLHEGQLQGNPGSGEAQTAQDEYQARRVTGFET